MVSERGRELVPCLTSTLLFVLVVFVASATAGGLPDVTDLASRQTVQVQVPTITVLPHAPKFPWEIGAQSPLTPAPPHPLPPPKGAYASGIVVEIRLNVSSPEIVIRTDAFGNVTQVYRISPRTSFRRVDLRSYKGEGIDLPSIFPGDFVGISIEFSVEGEIAHGVTVYVEEERGVVQDFGPASISLEDSRSFRLLPAVRVWVSGQLVKRDAVRPGSVVIIRINPRTREVTEILET